MGVHVILDIDPRGIDEAEWAATYDETLALVSAWQPRLLGWGWRAIEGVGVRVPMYMRSLGRDVDDPKRARWHVVGDRDSLQTAEGQVFYRDLGRYAAQLGECPDGDIVVTAAMPDRGDTSGPVRVFSGRTRGYPYHFAVLAAAMLVSLRASELDALQVCRAFLENAELRAYAMAIGRDEAAMREIGELAGTESAGGE
jgi:hypothetical protein